MLGGASVPCLDKDTVVKFYIKHADLRKTKPELADHPHFIASINYDPDADFVIRAIRPTIKDDLTLCLTQFKGYYSIKGLVPGVRGVFESIEWERYWCGTSIPNIGKPEMYQAYEDKLREVMDLRKTEKEPGTHPDFIISSRYNKDAEFVIRGVRPKVSDDINIYDTISDNTRYYSVQPLTEGVREVFDRIDWTKHWQGVSMPTVSIPDCIEVYETYK